MNGKYAVIAVLMASTMAFLHGCGSTSSTPQLITVSFSGASSQTIGQGQSASIVVTVLNDTSGRGVSWSLSGAGTLSKQTGTSVEYDAPASVPSNSSATIIAAAIADPSRLATYTVNLAAIAISVSPNPANVLANGSQVFTATVQNDSANKGVTWTISPSSGAGTLSNATSTTVTYKAPAGPPASDLTVTVTATSAATPTISGSATLTVPALTVGLAPASATVPAGSSQLFTATVNGDPGSQGVTWAISPASGAGTLSNVTKTSVSYNAPANTPSDDLTATVTATSAANAAISTSASILVPAISISVNPDNAVVPAGTQQTFTATISFDTKNQGVTWSISPSSGAGTLSNVTSTSVTYNAPAAAPASNLPATLTATSITNTSRSVSVTITVPAITVAVSPRSVLMPVNATQQFTGTVNNDPENKGAAWSAIQSGVVCGTACGTFSPASTASGAATTYTSPATVPATPAVSITAASVTDTTKSAAAQITLTNGTVKLIPAMLQFGFVKRNLSKSLPIALTNTGNTALTITSMVATTHYSETNDCGASVAPTSSCTITVKFAPGGIGNIVGTLTINDNSPDSPQIVALSGNGKSFAVSIPAAMSSEWSVAAPVPTGSSKIGTRVLDLVDAKREDPLANDGSKRELLVRFWYPATLHQQECQPAAYTTTAVWSYFSQLAGVPLPEVRTNSCEDAAIATGPHPVVMFTHGYTGTFTDYTFLFEDLASRGYVVAALDHTNEATAVEFPDGRIAKSVFGSHLGGNLRTDEEAYASAVLARLADFKFVLKELDRLNVTPQDPFAGKLDLSRVALAGHSLGGSAVLEGVAQEPRFKAGVVLDGASLNRFAAPTETPLFLLVTGREQWSVDECSLWSNLHKPRFAMKLPGADHLAVSDAVWLAKGVVKTGNLGPDKTVNVLREYVAAFLDANLRGQTPSSLLAGQSPNYPDVAVTTHAESLCGKE
jgi:dienelactone hydrolase